MYHLVPQNTDLSMRKFTQNTLQCFQRKHIYNSKKHYIAFLVGMYSVTRNKGQQILLMFVGVEWYLDFVRLKHI